MPLVLEILTVVGVTGYLSYQNGQKAVNDISYRLRDEVTDRVTEHLNDYFADADKITQTGVREIEANLLKGEDFSRVGRFFWNQARLHDVSYINYGLTTGEYIGSGHCIDRKNAMTITEISKDTGFKAHNYLTDDSGDRVGKPEVLTYDFRREPWFQNSVTLKKASWTEPYVWDNNPNMISMAISRPVRDGRGRIKGAISVDLSLTRISDFLAKIRLSPSGKVLVIDFQGRLVASSGSELPFRATEAGIERLRTADLPDTVTREAADYLQDKFIDLNKISAKYHGEFSIDNERYFLQVTPWRDRSGLNLLIMVVVPEKDFMGAIDRNTEFTLVLCLVVLIVAISIGVITAHQILKPIATTASAARSIAGGQWNQKLPSSSIEELNSLHRSFNRMAEQLRKYFSNLEHLAYHDPLTGLPNQASFRKSLEAEIAADVANRELFAVVFLDLDLFKLVNDSFGHLAGDRLLTEVARRLRSCVRCEDVVGRFGGDEFVILLRGLKFKEDALTIARRIHQEAGRAFTIDGNELFINVSTGIVFSDLYPMSAEEMLKNADIALYQSKNNGKGIYTVFSEEMSVNTRKRLRLETDLRRALARGEIEMHYQPIFSIPDREVIGFEALMRWRHPELGMIPPDTFIPIAEEIGLINSLGWWAVRHSCEQLKRWQEKYPGCCPAKINVNFSVKQFLETDFVPRLAEILAQISLAPHNLSVEVTESIFIKYTGLMREKLLELNRLGVKISLDDFGVGYSCLSYLKDFSIDILKLDRSFTQNLTANNKIFSIVEAINMLAGKLEIEIIAEGIETEEQLEVIHSLGCGQGQGYLFSRPLDAQQCEKLLEGIFAASLNNDRVIPFPQKHAGGEERNHQLKTLRGRRTSS